MSVTHRISGHGQILYIWCQGVIAGDIDWDFWILTRDCRPDKLDVTPQETQKIVRPKLVPLHHELSGQLGHW